LYRNGPYSWLLNVLPPSVSRRLLGSCCAHFKQTDFEADYTAASLIHERRYGSIYDGAGTGADLQLRLAELSSIFGREAHAHGLLEVHLYVDPPRRCIRRLPFIDSVCTAISIAAA
jgi:hypothetical protein